MAMKKERIKILKTLLIDKSSKGIMSKTQSSVATIIVAAKENITFFSIQYFDMI